jgi:hypothetical protein
MGKRVVSVVVAVLVAGSLGVAGVLVAERGRRAPATLPALEIFDDQAGATTQAQAAAGGAGPAIGRPPIAPSGRVQYQVRGKLPDLPDSSRAWTLDARVDRARVADLAGKLGLTAEPRKSGSTWMVTDGNRQLFVSALPGGPWTFITGLRSCGEPVRASDGVRPKAGAIACPTVGRPYQRTLPAPASGGQIASAGSSVAASGSPDATTPLQQVAPPSPTPSTRLQPPARVQLPDRAAAERVARDLLSRAGAPMAGIDLRLVQSFDRWSVSAFPMVDGKPTAGFLWTAGIGAKSQVLAATGWLGAPRPGDVYPLISEQEALQRLNERQIGGTIVESGVGTVAPRSLPCARSEVPPDPGGCGPARPFTLLVTDVRLGLQLASAVSTQATGAGLVSYLVPAYLFQINGSWDNQASVIAVQDRFLSSAPPRTAVPLRPAG